MALHPAVAACRLAVRHELGLPEGATVLVACSGGPDSTALLSATVFEGHKAGLRVIGVTVDHGLQEGSADHAALVVRRMAAMGVDETASARVTVSAAGLGVEAAARRARYDVLEQMREHFGADRVLLGHTRDDQAETVLLGLTRGSGARSLAGMRRSFDHYARPLLEVSRDDTVTACQVEGLAVWSDPHNDDPGFTRVRVRQRVLPVLEDELGPGIAETLARTADQVRDDVELLDAMALAAYEEMADLEVAELGATHPALRARVLRLAALDAGAIDAELFHVHVTRLVALVVGEIRGEVQLPGHVTAHLSDGHLRFRSTRVEA
ncbi:MAG: tRNA lysidine(34) synthetase TilS [Nocardioidaceae bacterium]|nr:tRNA lysidine(34) synthetase TilS [Nocardioidaceae bacterium]